VFSPAVPDLSSHIHLLILNNQNSHTKSDTMSKLTSPTHAHIPLLYRFLYDGLGRVSDLMNTSQFTFRVNDKVFATSVVEAVLLSPAVHENVTNDLTFTEFIVKGSNISSDDFLLFLEIIRFGRITISHSRLESLIEIHTN
jgi:hypothetical protein